MAGILDFKGKLAGGGARPNLFKATVHFPTNVVAPSIETTSFMIKAAALPASVIAPIEVPFRGRKLKIAGDRTFEPWTITVINDTGMEIRSAFEQWMDKVNAHATNTSEYVQGNSTNALDYMRQMSVVQLDRNEIETYGYTFYGAFPTNISAIDLNYETNDTIEEFTVELNYQYWTSVGTDLNG